MRNWIKLVLAVAAVVALCSPVFRASLSIAALGVAERHIAIAAPRYSGFTRDGRRGHELTADATFAERLNLVEPQASLQMTDGRRIELRAAEGVFDPLAKVLTMRRNVVLTRGIDHEVRGSEAVVDMQKNTVIFNGAIEIQLEKRTIRGSRLEVHEGGQLVVSDGSIIEADQVIRFAAYALP